MECNKTKLTVSLKDERTEQPIAGAVYSVDGREDLVTDENGEFELSDFEKEVKYTLTVSSLPDDYLKKNTEIVFTVDNSGLINKSASYVYKDTAYMIALSAEINDLLFGRAAAGTDLSLFDEDGNKVEDWTSGDEAHIVAGLKEGTYYLRKSQDGEELVSVKLEDTSKLQKITVRNWHTIDLYAVLVGLIALAVIIVIVIRRKKAGNKRERKE